MSIPYVAISQDYAKQKHEDNLFENSSGGRTSTVDCYPWLTENICTCSPASLLEYELFKLNFANAWSPLSEYFQDNK